MHRTTYPALSSSGTSRPPMYPDAPVTRQRNGDDMLSVLHGPAGAITSAGAARPAPCRPRVESIWTFPEGYEVTARAATETAPGSGAIRTTRAWIPGELSGIDIASVAGGIPRSVTERNW